MKVISARKGEFETGYERGGQTREHVLLAKTLGVAKLLVVVNKMDEPTVKWSKERCSSHPSPPPNLLLILPPGLATYFVWSHLTGMMR